MHCRLDATDHGGGKLRRAPTRIFKGGQVKLHLDVACPLEAALFSQSSSASRFTAGAFGFLTFTSLIF
jgi:hypothetical protein